MAPRLISPSDRYHIEKAAIPDDGVPRHENGLTVCYRPPKPEPIRRRADPRGRIRKQFDQGLNIGSRSLRTQDLREVGSPYEDSQPCLSCDGTGTLFVQGTEEEVECPDCEGTGTIAAVDSDLANPGAQSFREGSTNTVGSGRVAGTDVEAQVFRSALLAARGSRSRRPYERKDARQRITREKVSCPVCDGTGTCPDAYTCEQVAQALGIAPDVYGDPSGGDKYTTCVACAGDGTLDTLYDGNILSVLAEMGLVPPEDRPSFSAAKHHRRLHQLRRCGPNCPYCAGGGGGMRRSRQYAERAYDDTPPFDPDPYGSRPASEATVPCPACGGTGDMGSVDAAQQLADALGDPLPVSGSDCPACHGYGVLQTNDAQDIETLDALQSLGYTTGYTSMRRSNPRKVITRSRRQTVRNGQITPDPTRRSPENPVVLTKAFQRAEAEDLTFADVVFG